MNLKLGFEQYLNCLCSKDGNWYGLNYPSDYLAHGQELIWNMFEYNSDQEFKTVIGVTFFLEFQIAGYFVGTLQKLSMWVALFCPQKI